MFKEIKNFLTSYIIENKVDFMLEEFEIFGNKKAEYLIESQLYLALFEIYSDFTVDFMITENKSENVIFSETVTYSNLQELFRGIEINLNILSYRCGTPL